MNALLEKLPVLMLVLVRVGGLFLLAPFFSHAMISAKVKVFFAIVFSVMMAAIVPAPGKELVAMGMIGACMGEFLIGLALGLGFRIVVSSASVAGEFMGLQMGMGAAALYDPSTEQQVSPLEQFYSATFLMVFVSLDGHHHFLRVFKESFTLLPLARGQVAGASLEGLVLQAAQMLSCGCRMAAPVIVPLLLVSLAVALVSRACPQVNVWSLSYGVSIFAGFLLIAASITNMSGIAQNLIHGMDRWALRLLQVMGGSA